MITDELRSLLRAQPFKPFTLVTPDGAQVRVHHHDYAWMFPSGSEMFIEDADGRRHIVNASHVTRLLYDDAPEHRTASGADLP